MASGWCGCAVGSVAHRKTTSEDQFQILIPSSPTLLPNAPFLLQIGDRFASVCSGCDVCDTCTMELPKQIPTCLEAIEHSSSPGGNLVTLETLSIEAGYWRATNHSTAVLPCYNTDACVGGMTGSPDYCNEGYTGPCGFD